MQNKNFITKQLCRIDTTSPDIEKWQPVETIPVAECVQVLTVTGLVRQAHIPAGTLEWRLRVARHIGQLWCSACGAHKGSTLSVIGWRPL